MGLEFNETPRVSQPCYRSDNIDVFLPLKAASHRGASNRQDARMGRYGGHAAPLLEMTQLPCSDIRFQAYYAGLKSLL
jgi:hypothetical protein